MKILIISPFRVYPIHCGFSTRVYNLTKQLSYSNSVFLYYTDYNKKECNPDDCSFLPNVTKRNFKVSYKFMQLINPSLIFEAVSAIKKEKINIIIAEGIWAGPHAMILSFLTKVPYCFTEHNVEHVRWKRMGRKYPGLLRIFEKYCCKFSKKIFCMSNNDRQQISELGVDINKLTIAPNGIDTLQFRPRTSKKYDLARKLKLDVESPVILFFGNLSYTPNLQAVQIIYEKIIDSVLEAIPNVKFVIVGSNPPLQFQHEAMIFPGFVENIEDYINASDLVIAPLISGGGTKLKIIEAIACGKTVLTTSIGAEGLVDESTRYFLKVIDDWNDFINFIVDFLKNPIVNDLPSIFIEKYSWKSIGEIISKEISMY
ncbi:glycosyltransferase family 4 protein [Methanosarcina sp.]|uniref:glycosyltransferase family 4 protein n=1 Tax=Methanosarcina sp. TaxID=2213 RepID=UPI0029891264|nr:glycosyltransferase family 4 protein [Methanosarcina sp.]MDW5549183.1 glycosyltransferase family 4 protein [Methanosarcina sp.]MDW5553111.1 glycosyltransferase family 4 protein [Methanosarcina sp.]MDW5559363.1 glycosyltransferase family 4 protein [Methanosarcina sp.]